MYRYKINNINMIINKIWKIIKGMIYACEWKTFQRLSCKNGLTQNH